VLPSGTRRVRPPTGSAIPLLGEQRYPKSGRTPGASSERMRVKNASRRPGYLERPVAIDDPRDDEERLWSIDPTASAEPTMTREAVSPVADDLEPLREPRELVLPGGAEILVRRLALTTAVVAAGLFLVQSATTLVARLALPDPAPAAVRRFVVLSLTVAFFSLDDWLEYHERVGNGIRDAAGVPDYVGGLWVTFYVPLLAIVFWALVRTAVEAPRPVRLTLLAAVALLLASVAVELLGIPTKALAQSGVEWPHDIRSTLEEGFELGGWILAAGGMLAVFAAVAAAAGGRRP
jgi:hypothetical protein